MFRKFPSSLMYSDAESDFLVAVTRLSDHPERTFMSSS